MKLNNKVVELTHDLLNTSWWIKYIHYINSVSPTDKFTYKGNQVGVYYGIRNGTGWCGSVPGSDLTKISLDEAMDIIDGKRTELPESWYIKREAGMTWGSKAMEIIHYLSPHWDGYRESYGHYKGAPDYGIQLYRGDAVLLSVDEAHSLIFNKQKQTAMKTVKMSESFFRLAYKTADDLTKEQIKANVNAFDLETTDSFVREMYIKYKNCPEWEKRIKEEFPTIIEDSKDVDLSEDNGLVLFKRDGGGNQVLLAVRRDGLYRNKAFYVNPSYNWELKKDDTGHFVLIPTKK